MFFGSDFKINKIGVKCMQNVSAKGMELSPRLVEFLNGVKKCT
jgi:hypothetical protein